MNNKGQVIMFGFMLAVVIIVFALGVSHMIRQSSDEAMTNMNCTTTNDKYIQAGCLVSDINPFYFIGILLAIAGMVIGARILFGGTE